MNENDHLTDLERRVADAQGKHNPPLADGPNGNPSMAIGMRIFTEMLGVLLGSGLIGWGLDQVFGTTPAFLIGLVVLGIIAAFFNAYKVATNFGSGIGFPRLQPGAKNVTETQEKTKSGNGEG